MDRTYNCWMLNCWCITWPVGFKMWILHVPCIVWKSTYKTNLNALEYTHNRRTSSLPTTSGTFPDYGTRWMPKHVGGDFGRLLSVCSKACKVCCICWYLLCCYNIHSSRWSLLLSYSWHKCLLLDNLNLDLYITLHFCRHSQQPCLIPPTDETFLLSDEPHCSSYF